MITMCIRCSDEVVYIDTITVNDNESKCIYINLSKVLKEHCR